MTSPRQPETATAALAQADGNAPRRYDALSPSERIAEVCHEANRAYCRTLGDTSQPAWPLAPDWQRQSAIDGVEAILAGRVSSPEQSHTNWCREKWAAGWQYGPVKDPVQRFHPCLVPYEDLPSEQRMKDALFFAIVRALTPEHASPSSLVDDSPGAVLGPPPSDVSTVGDGDATGPEV